MYNCKGFGAMRVGPMRIPKHSGFAKPKRLGFGNQKPYFSSSPRNPCHRTSIQVNIETLRSEKGNLRTSSHSNPPGVRKRNSPRRLDMLPNLTKTRGVYVLSNNVWTPPSELEMTVEATASLLSNVLDQASLDESVRQLGNLPICDRTALPAGYHAAPGEPIQLSIDVARDEITHTFETAVKPCFDELLEHRVTNEDILVVVAASNRYTSVPPQSARLCNILGCSSDVTGINLTGTGETLGQTAVAVAASMLRARPEPGVAVVAMSENMSTLLYGGRDDRFLASNVDKRLGCATVILSTRRRDKKLAAYKLVEHASTSKYFNAEEVRESFELDAYGVFGSRRSEQFVYEFNLQRQVRAVVEKCLSLRGADGVHAAHHDYSDSNHVIVQPSHPVVIKLGYEALGIDPAKNPEEVDSSISAFYRYGDVGLAGCWYALAHRESVSGIKEGERVLLLGIGNNLHTGALVLEARRNIRGTAWDDTTSILNLREKFWRAIAGVMPERPMLKRISRREDMLAKSASQLFFPYTHGVWSSDMRRYIRAMDMLEPLYRKLVAEEGRGDDEGAAEAHTTLTVEA